MEKKLNYLILYLIFIGFGLKLTPIVNNEVFNIVLHILLILSCVISIVFHRKTNIIEYIKKNYLIIFYIIFRVVSILFIDNKIQNLKTLFYEIYFVIIINNLFYKNKHTLKCVSIILVILNLIMNISTVVLGIFGVEDFKTIIYTNTNPMGSFTCLSMLLFITYLYKNKSKSFKSLSIIYVLFSLIVIYLSESRTPILMIICYILVLFINNKKIISEDRIKSILIYIINVSVLIVICFSYINSNNNVPTDLEVKINNCTTNRYYLCKYSILSLGKSPIFGVGDFNIGESRFKEISNSMLKCIPNYRVQRLRMNNNHNGYIQLLVSNGYIAYIVFMLWIYKKIKNVKIRDFSIISSILILNIFENQFILSANINALLMMYLLAKEKNE